MRPLLLLRLHVRPEALFSPSANDYIVISCIAGTLTQYVGIQWPWDMLLIAHNT